MRVLTVVILCLSIFISCGTSEDDRVYTINIQAVPAEAGTVTPASGEFESGRSLEISATPNQHWVFSRWEGDHTGTVNPSAMVIDGNKSIKAVFIPFEAGKGTVDDPYQIANFKQINQINRDIDMVKGTVCKKKALEFIEFQGFNC